MANRVKRFGEVNNDHNHVPFHCQEPGANHQLA